jgi:hypothetical protein
MHSTGDIRLGVSKARRQAHPEDLAAIVKALSSQPVYARAFAGEAFPKTYSEIRSRTRLGRTEPQKEFLWCASVVSLYSDKLSDFVSRRVRFEKRFLNGEYDEAEDILNQIEADFGVSIWLSATRIQLLQLKYGLKAQKDYLEEILSSTDLDFFVAFLSYFFSLRSEESVSQAAIELEAIDLLQVDWMRDYAIYQILPHNLTHISDPSAVIRWDEAYPIIDRLHSLVLMAQLQVSRGGVKDLSYIEQAMKLISGIGDPRADRILQIFDGPNSLHSDEIASGLAIFDSYSVGAYSEVIADPHPLYELKARAGLYLGHRLSNTKDNSISQQIIAAMADVLSASGNYNKSVLQLQKLALTCMHLPEATKIAAFVERHHDQIRVEEYSPLDRFTAVVGEGFNPWDAEIIEKHVLADGTSHKLLTAYPNSTALRLRQSLHVGELESGLPIPSYRADMYNGHIALAKSDFRTAASYYKKAVSSGVNIVTIRGSAYLFEALFALGEINNCLSLVVDHCLTNPDAHRLYPIEQLAKAILDDDTIENPLLSTILLHIAARYVHPKWERDLSDAFENFLAWAGISRPTDLEQQIDKFDRDRAIYFLRYICVPRTLDDTTIYDDMLEIENERIQICQLLSRIDHENSDVYSSEIRVITRDIRISELLQQVESSKIYVDEDGIRVAVEGSLRDAFSRFQTLTKTPELGYQAEKITKRIEEFLGDSAAADLKNFRPPTSEREGIFNSMFSQLVSQFATNPAYGLDTHLSTSIRHGAFEGHFRSPFAAEDLLCIEDKQTGDYALPARWRVRFEGYSNDEVKHIHRQMVRFTQRIEQIIEHCLFELIQVRGTDIHQQGMFNFSTPWETRATLMASISATTTYEEFVDRNIAYCWEVTDRSLEEFQAELKGPISQQVNNALDTLISSIESRMPHENVADLSDSLVRARTEFQMAVDRISEWFRRPADIRRNPFEIELAVGVALKQIENCYTNSSIEPELNLNIPYKIQGAFLDGIVEILFILLQNVIRHSGFGDMPVAVSIHAYRNETEICLEVTNELAPEIDVNSRREVTEEAMRRYAQDTALKMARIEGGSGLSKVWRILEYDMGREHQLRLKVSDDRKVTAAIRFNDAGVLVC